MLQLCLVVVVGILLLLLLLCRLGIICNRMDIEIEWYGCAVCVFVCILARQRANQTGTYFEELHDEVLIDLGQIATGRGRHWLFDWCDHYYRFVFYVC